MYKHILVPTDGSDITRNAIDTAIALAKSLGARISAVAVREPFPYSAVSEMQAIPPQEFFEAQDRIVNNNLLAVKEACSAAGLSCTGAAVEALHPWEAILEQAKSGGCDLIVMASHGRRGVSALLLGSETQKVLTHSTIPVLVVR